MGAVAGGTLEILRGGVLGALTPGLVPRDAVVEVLDVEVALGKTGPQALQLLDGREERKGGRGERGRGEEGKRGRGEEGKRGRGERRREGERVRKEKRSEKSKTCF